MAPPPLKLRASRAARATAAVALAASSWWTLPSQVGAVTAIPDEPGATRLDETVFSAVTADIDGDGVREVVRIAAWAIDESRMAVDVVRADGAGKLSRSAPTRLRRAVSVDQRLNGDPVDAEGMTAVLNNDLARLVVWHQGGRDRVLAIANTSRNIGDEAPCCITGWEVTEPVPGEAPTLTLIFNQQRGGYEVMAIDLDGDGTDELAIHEPSQPGDPGGALTVLRWNGSRFERMTAPLQAGDVVQMWRLGNTDGRPGDEIAFTGVFGPDSSSPAYGLTRVSMRDGHLAFEAAEMANEGLVLGIGPADGSGVGEIVYGAGAGPLVAMAWPSGEVQPQTIATAADGGRPVAVLGSGSGTRLLVVRRRGNAPVLALLPTDLKLADAQVVHASPAALRFADSAFPPFVGFWPSSTPVASSSYVVEGAELTWSGDAVPTQKIVSALPGAAPVGPFGPDGKVIGLVQVSSNDGAAPDVDPRGGPLATPGGAWTMTAAPADVVLKPESDGGRIAPALGHAVPDPSSRSGGGLALASSTFETQFDAPAGSLAQANAGQPSQVLHLTDATTQTSTDVSGPPFVVPINVPSPPASAPPAVATLFVVTAAGHGYWASWPVRVLPSAPPLHADGSLFSLGFSAEITGKTDPTSTVTAQGSSATPGPDGRFSISVPADLIPHLVTVRSTDPFGRRTTTTVSVVGPVDYRRLPWIPIVAVLTLAAGIAFFLRAPRLARPPVPARDDATLEEIDADQS